MVSPECSPQTLGSVIVPEVLIETASEMSPDQWMKNRGFPTQYPLPRQILCKRKGRRLCNTCVAIDSKSPGAEDQFAGNMRIH